MNIENTGRFIAELRREKGLTQAELAQQLGVTDKAVSRWETGKGLPDTSLLRPLAAALEVSIGELLAGERMDAEQRARRADDQILDALRYSRRMLGWTVDFILLILAFLLLSFVGVHQWVPSAALASVAAVRITLRIRGVTLPPGVLRILAAASLAGAFLLELLPAGVVMRFASPDGLLPPQYYSYFNLLPFGYGDFAPLFTGSFTVAALVSAALALLLRGRAGRLRGAAFVCSALALVLSLFPLLLFGGMYMTWVSYTVSGCLLTALCLFAFAGEG